MTASNPASSPVKLQAALAEAQARIAELEAVIAAERQQNAQLRAEREAHAQQYDTVSTEHADAARLASVQRDLARLIAQDLPATAIWAACLHTAIKVSNLDCGGLYLFDSNNRTVKMARCFRL
ncbi:MAG: hypothetical protein AB4911_20450 [Oscillochloridaceae bacterium umkhey_bin13]